MKRYEEFGESIIFLLKPIIEKIPKPRRSKFKSKLIKKLEDYEFVRRRKDDPPHENSIEARGEIDYLKLNPNNPDDVFKAIITIMHGFYLAPTQNRIKKYVEKNL